MLRDQMFPSGTSNYGIAIGLDSTNGDTCDSGSPSFPVSSDIQIANNSVGVTFDGTSSIGYSNGEGILVHAGTNIIITGNTLNDALLGIGVNPFNSGDLVSNITISNNSYFGPANSESSHTNANEGISVEGSSTTTIPSNIVIANNVLGQANLIAANSSFASIALAANNVIVTGNFIYSSNYNGIALRGANNELLIMGNYIYNVTGSGSNGIYGYAGTQAGRIRGNFVTSATNGYNFSSGISSSPNLLFGTNDSSSVTTALINNGGVTITTF